ncbi:MAG: RHS repeat-associated protein [Crocinitomicaceae bacterium]|jgi:RHS repeat-associated protein
MMMTSDYYPFGMQMPGRHTEDESYRYAYNGMEQDNEVSGNGNSYTTEFRQYDPRLGRWKSLDPLMRKYPSMSPYVAFNNNPILLNDPKGDDPPPTRLYPNREDAPLLRGVNADDFQYGYTIVKDIKYTELRTKARGLLQQPNTNLYLDASVGRAYEQYYVETTPASVDADGNLSPQEGFYVYAEIVPKAELGNTYQARADNDPTVQDPNMDGLMEDFKSEFNKKLGEILDSGEEIESIVILNRGEDVGVTVLSNERLEDFFKEEHPDLNVTVNPGITGTPNNEAGIIANFKTKTNEVEIDNDTIIDNYEPVKESEKLNPD